MGYLGWLGFNAVDEWMEYSGEEEGQGWPLDAGLRLCRCGYAGLDRGYAAAGECGRGCVVDVDRAGEGDWIGMHEFWQGVVVVWGMNGIDGGWCDGFFLLILGTEEVWKRGREELNDEQRVGR